MAEMLLNQQVASRRAEGPIKRLGSRYHEALKFSSQALPPSGSGETPPESAALQPFGCSTLSSPPPPPVCHSFWVFPSLPHVLRV